MSECKKVWIIRTLAGNPLAKEERQERAGALASYLAQKGYKVTFWGSAFDHFQKKFTYNQTIHKWINENEDIVLLHTESSYKKNVSIQRLRFGCEIAKVLSKEMRKSDIYPKPDLIFVAYPTSESCQVAEQFGREYGIPVIVDARDMWPDIFGRAFPNYMKFLASWILAPLKIKAAKVFSDADALCAVSPVMLSWALSYAQREKSSTDRVIFIGSKKYLPSQNILKLNLKMLEEKNITSETWNICLFTTLSSMGLDADTMIDAIALVHETYPQIRLIIGGTGDDEQRLRTLIKDKPYVQMFGWMNQEQMASVMSISKAGIIPYKNTIDLKNAWGNKFGQFFSYGLPIFNSTEGIAKKYLEAYNCGVTYRERDSEDLAKKIIELICNPGRIKILSENARMQFEKDFDEEIIFESFEKMIRDTYESYHEKS